MNTRFGTAAGPFLIWIVAMVLILGAWQMLVWLSGLPPYVIPPPALAFSTLFENWPRLSVLTGQTLYETAIGYVAGALIGFVLALAMGQIRVVQRLVMPALIISQAVPIVAVAAPLVIIFGFGLMPKLIIVAWIVFFPVVVNVLDGLASVDRDMLNLARLMGGGSLRTFAIVKLPACIGPLFSGLKIGATYAVTGAVIGEWTASSKQGLGTYLLTANAQMNTAGVYAAMLLLTVIGVGSFLLVFGLEVLATPWRSRSTAPAWAQWKPKQAAV
ncbi:ABC transporter permease [Mesorhizobium sp.]|jgi:ABC-type nitrate/sulfonate/bicarbonate transport system permease component|uniref:ABC transporter permease n=1 Tax=Mesorhizobium sp. TaxID=1871066 RepID=UPI003567C281